MRHPPAVLHVRLVPAQILHLLRVGQDHLQPSFLQNVEYRSPVRPGALHRYLLALLF